MEDIDYSINYEDSGTPPAIAESANAATLNLLPPKSREKYEDEYCRFKDWCNKEKIKKVSENILLAYFSDLAKTYKASTLWSKYSMVKAVILIRENIDISRFSKLIAFLKRQSDGYQAKKSKIFTKEQVDKFMVEAPDKDYLLMKVVAIMGVAGACRRQELVSMRTDDIQDLGSAIIVKVPVTKNKMERVFSITVPEDASFNSIEIIRKYLALRPKHTTHHRLFIFYKNWKCTVQPVGLHTIGKIPTKIAQYLHLSDHTSYTGHCFRRCSASFLADSGANLTTIKRHGGWKSSAVAEGYLEDSIENKKKIANKIFSRENSEVSVNKSSTNTTVESEKCISDITGAEISVPSGFNINNCTNCNFHLNINVNK